MPAPNLREIRNRLSALRNRHEARNGPATLRDHDRPTFPDFVEECRQVMTSFANACGAHAPIVSLVILVCI